MLDCLNWMKMDPIIVQTQYALCPCLGICNRKCIPDHYKSIKGTLGSRSVICMFHGTKNFKWGAVGECMFVVWLFMFHNIFPKFLTWVGQTNLLPRMFSRTKRQIKGYQNCEVGTSSQVDYVPNLAKHLFNCGTKAPISIFEWSYIDGVYLRIMGPQIQDGHIINIKKHTTMCIITFQAAICHFEILRDHKLHMNIETIRNGHFQLKLKIWNTFILGTYRVLTRDPW